MKRRKQDPKDNPPREPQPMDEEADDDDEWDGLPQPRAGSRADSYFMALANL